MGCTNKDFSRFDAMSTEELKIFLQGYLIAPEIKDDSAEMDAVLYVMGVVAKREKVEHPELYHNPRKEWDRFTQLYMPSGEEIEEVQKNSNKVVAIKENGVAPKKVQRHSRWYKMGAFSRVASIVLVVLILGIAGMGVAQASGYDVFGAVATWTDEIFTFRSRSGNLSATVSSEPPVAYSSLQEALDTYGVDVPLAPQWIPEKYRFADVVVSEILEELYITAGYVSPDGEEITVIINVLSNPGFNAVEKDAGGVKVYKRGGVDHYITTNMGYTQASWVNENCECFLTCSDISIKQLKQIIDSIYRR